MKYALLIYADPAAEGVAGEDATREMYRAFGEFTRELVTAGKLGAAEELQPSAKGRSVRIRDGRPVVTDGPYLEAREELGGLFLIEADDLDEAVRWAARVPSATYGTVQVRPLVIGTPPEPG